MGPNMPALLKQLGFGKDGPNLVYKACPCYKPIDHLLMGFCKIKFMYYCIFIMIAAELRVYVMNSKINSF